MDVCMQSPHDGGVADIAWLHQIFFQGDSAGRTPLNLEKVDTAVNTADCGTKPLLGPRLRMLTELCGMRF